MCSSSPLDPAGIVDDPTDRYYKPADTLVAKSLTDPKGFIEEGLEDAKMSHTFGSFLNKQTGGDKTLGRLFDPAHEDVEHNADPVLFGDPSKGKSGLFDNPLTGMVLNFVPFGGLISAGGNILNRQSDYEHMKNAGYDVDYGKSVVNPALTQIGTSYLMNQTGGDPYGYGTSVGGQAGTAATNAGIGSALRGETLDQQLRNATIGGASGALGAYAADETGSSQAGSFASGLGNLGLRQLWEDPEQRSADEYYNSLINTYNSYNRNRGDFDQSMIGDLQQLQALPQDSPLLSMFQQEQESAARKRGSVGGSGQFTSGNDQVYEPSGQDTYLV